MPVGEGDGDGTGRPGLGGADVSRRVLDFWYGWSKPISERPGCRASRGAAAPHHSYNLSFPLCVLQGPNDERRGQ